VNATADPPADSPRFSAAQEAPLHFAVIAGKLKAAAYLIDRGADANASDRGGRTPLHQAVSSGIPELVALLLARGARRDVKDDQHFTPLDIADLRENPAVEELLRK
jgi:ankyrin repeat protein